MIRVRRVGRVRPVGRVGRGKRVRRVNGWTLTKTDLLPRDPRQTRQKKDTHIEKSKTLFSKSERSDLYVDLSRQLYGTHHILIKVTVSTIFLGWEF